MQVFLLALLCVRQYLQEVKTHPQMPFLLAEWTGHFVVQVFQIVQEQVW
jgi:hypothetical protein